MAKQDRIYLSPPHMSGDEITRVNEAFASNWIAPLGPHVEAKASLTLVISSPLMCGGER